MSKKTKTIILSVFIAVAVIASVVLICVYAGGRDERGVRLHRNNKDTESNKLFDADNSFWVKEKVNIDVETIQDGLRDMGVLVTQEYDFTQAETYEKTTTILGIPSTARIMYSYDGVVYAGIDCNDIAVAKNDDKKEVTVTLPKSTITSVEIDYDSFQEYEEKQGLWSKIKLEDVNKSMVEFQNTAKSKAVSKGVLEKADSNAELIIERFVKALVDLDDYKLTFIHA